MPISAVSLSSNYNRTTPVSDYRIPSRFAFPGGGLRPDGRTAGEPRRGRGGEQKLSLPRIQGLSPAGSSSHAKSLKENDSLTELE